MSARPVLVTAFGPFPGVEENPTQRVLELVRAQWDEAQRAEQTQPGTHEAHPGAGRFQSESVAAHPGTDQAHRDVNQAPHGTVQARPDTGQEPRERRQHSHPHYRRHPHPLVSEVLEVAFASVPGRVRSLILEHRPALTVCMGVDASLAGGTPTDARLASRASAEASPADGYSADGYLAPGIPARMALEATAFNEFGAGVADARGETASGPVVPGGPATWASPFRVDEAVAALKAAGLPIARSDDAGRYLCNAALAVACDTAAELPDVGAVFLHIPPAEALDPQVAAHAVLALASNEAWWEAP
ncbi:MAG: hypothetical protein Q3979_02880 [Actinomycetaceae bacterium]|nr:hypothetical protein [Actinomycetaceae bacterium]